MIFSKDVVSNVLAFIKTKWAAAISSIETKYTVTITPLTQFDIVNPANLQFPVGVLYEHFTNFETDELHSDNNRFRLYADFYDSRADLDQLRNNLWGYRDALVNIINDNRDLGGSTTQAYLFQAIPSVVMTETGNYNGIMQIQFVVEIQN